MDLNSVATVARISSSIVRLNEDITKEIAEHLIDCPASCRQLEFEQRTINKMREVDALLMVLGHQPAYKMWIENNVSRLSGD
ncbi:hypothetical protein [Alteromonas oceanisediminis]|uniref:hypothetical protein n=1 Tax=Alteromonas oceanisediminis TaxID=2836180 RepID=UPI001BD9E15E|nr:hypothetical protein [Alteromonas oceanisediminis]